MPLRQPEHRRLSAVPQVEAQEVLAGLAVRLAR